MEIRKKSIEIGTIKGSVIVISHSRQIRDSKKSYKFIINCQCNCGEFCSFETGNFKRINNPMCGNCKNRAEYKTINGNSTRKDDNELEYKSYYTWKAMRRRCTDEKDKRYSRYGGRGIKVCERWKDSYKNFLEDMGIPPSTNHSIERLNNDGDHEPKNCIWGTKGEQANNKSNNRNITAFGKTQTLMQWADETGIKRETIAKRLNSGKSPEIALSVQKSSQYKYVTPKGSFISLKEVCEIYGLKNTAIHSRFESDKYPEFIKILI